MNNEKDIPLLLQVFKRLLLFRLFLPLIFLTLIISIGISYNERQNIVDLQLKTAQSMANIITYHVNLGSNIIDAIAKTAEVSEKHSLSIFMESTWKAYGYFDTIYYLDENNRIDLLIPLDPRINGFDMSNIPDFKKGKSKDDIIISRPFISIRTGEPTVYLIKHLIKGGTIVGELKLGILQQEISKILANSKNDYIYIMNASGGILAHPSLDYVKQQTNFSDLEIFNKAKDGETNAIYKYNGKSVFGSAIRMDKYGWYIVNQQSVSVFFNIFLKAFAIVIVGFFIIWSVINWSLSKQLDRYIIMPLEKLSKGTNAMAAGNYKEANSICSNLNAFVELNILLKDFNAMSQNLQLRENALKESEKEKRRVLEQALIMKDEFISLISHELKTPLNVIYSAIQLIEGVYIDQVPDKVRSLLDSIKQNTFRQLRLVNNLLDITRLNSGQVKLNVKKNDIVFLTKVIVESVELFSSEKNIKIEFKGSIDEKIISIDDEKFERIILNILSNAIKFTNPGGQITVILEEITQSNMIQIKIKDTGIGIPKDKMQFIFERFGQVESNLSRQAEGTGIGLYIVKLLVSILEGSIYVESEVGVGSIFTLMLPIKEGSENCNSEQCLNIDNRLVNEIKVEFSDIYF